VSSKGLFIIEKQRIKEQAFTPKKAWNMVGSE
jgi:hypothetical protein